jgi:hypothetical protein
VKTSINIVNRLESYGLEPEIYTHPDRVKEVLVVEGFGEIAEDFIRHLTNRMQKSESDFFEYDGYWREDEDGTFTLAIVGAAYTRFDREIRLRGIGTREVKNHLLEDVRADLTLMMFDYLDELEKIAYQKYMEKYQPSGGVGSEFGGGKSQAKCSICGKIYAGFGNNPWPINEGRCCDQCNEEKVLPARIKLMANDPDRFKEREI